MTPKELRSILFQSIQKLFRILFYLQAPKKLNVPRIRILGIRRMAFLKPCVNTQNIKVNPQVNSTKKSS